MVKLGQSGLLGRGAGSVEVWEPTERFRVEINQESHSVKTI